MRQISQSTTIVAPVGGLNTYDSISSMPETEALILRNWLPASYGCQLRQGSRLHADEFTGDVSTLMTWSSSAGVSKVFAVDDDGIYDITTIGAVSGTPAVAVTNSWLQHTNMGNAAGNHLIAFNGTDNGFWYSAAGWQRLAAGDGSVAGTWNGVDPADLIQCTVHQKRLWAVEVESNLAWYLPPNQLYGVAASFDFGPCFTRGGYLQALTTWTHDGGNGPEDYLLAISSGGQVAVYKGLDPSSADTWELVGVYFIGETFTRRCWIQYGGDVVFLTSQGLLTMAGILKSTGGTNFSNALSRKIQSTLSNLTIEGSTRDGWELVLYTPANMLMVNIPGTSTSQNVQLVFNTIRGGWSVFTGIPAVSWITDDETIFFGTTGAVYRFWEGYVDQADYDNDNGVNVVGYAQQAFSHFNALGASKHFKMVRPTFISTDVFRYNVGLNTDYTFNAVDGIGDFPERSNGGTWDVSEWDSSDAVWGGGTNVINEWLSVVGLGFTGAITLVVESASELIWTSTDWIYEIGGPI